MNRKFLLVLSLSFVFLAAVSCKSRDEKAAENVEKPAAGVVAGDITIAYINTDTLINNYEYFKEKKAAYEEKATKAQNELQSKSRSFERDMVQYQEQVQKGLITRAEAAEKEANLQRTQQSLLQYRDQVMAELGEQEQVMLNNIQNNIQEFLKEYNADRKYGLILSTNAMTNVVLSGDPALDITMDVLKGLNEKHAAAKKETGAAPVAATTTGGDKGGKK